LQNWEPAVEEIHGWPGYEPQPLWVLPNRARQLGIADLYYKDESQRFGRELASFKALGAPYAVFSLLRDAVEQATGRRPTAAELRAGEFKAITERVTMCVATDGNQGRGLAFGAQTFGCRCVVYIHGHVSEGRKEAIERYGRSSSGSMANTSSRLLVPGRTPASMGGISSAALPGTTSTSRSRGT
jgi:diaminopropionate ammonia-lyase